MSGGGLNNIAPTIASQVQTGQGGTTQPTGSNTGYNRPQFNVQNPTIPSRAQNWWTNTEQGRAAGGQEGLNKTLRTQIQDAMGNYGNMVNYANKTGISQQDIQTAIGGNTDMYTYMNRPNYQKFGTNGQFNQPIYQSNYQNNANPLTAFNVSTYGTTPARSNASQWWQNQGATDQQYMDRLRSQAPSYQNMNIGDLARSMQQFGISPSDMQAAGSYGGSTFGGFNPGVNIPQMNTPFNPYTNSYAQQTPTAQPTATATGNTLTPELARELVQRAMTGQGVPTSEFAKYGGYDKVAAMYEAGGGKYDKPGTTTGTTTQQMQPNYQQTPFNYSQQIKVPTYGTANQAIVGRSSSLRGTPNVMARKAEGGIASLMGDVE